jgi:hypothetical protein
MRKYQLLGAALGALTLGAAGAASAATFIQPWTTSPTGAISVTIGDNGLGVAGGSTDAVNGNSTHVYDAATNTFTDTFDLFLPTGKAGSSVITTLSGQSINDLTFSSIVFNGVGGTTSVADGQASAHIGFQPVSLGGPQELVITGTGGSAATFGGTVSFVLNAAGGAPEASTWALMIVGFGGAGAVMRRRRAQGAAA